MNVVRSGSDEELLALFIDGSEDAFQELMRRHEPRVFGVALKITGSRNDALDATQDAFITAFRRASTFRGDAAFGTWLFRIAINAAKDVVRKRKPTEELGDEEAAAGPGRVDESVALRIDLTRALAQLPDEYRDAVVMHDLGGIPYEEIAGLTSVAIGTVKSRISRGRRRLAELLEPRTAGGSSKDQR